MLTTLLLKPIFLLILFIPQNPKPETVSVVLTPDQPIVTMTVNEAEKRIEDPKTDPKLRAAIVWALGTRYVRPEPVRLRPDDEFRERFQRQPAQSPIPEIP